MTSLPEIGDILVFEFGFRRQEVVVKKRSLFANLVYVSFLNQWFSLGELRRGSASVVGKYVKILGPFGYKKYNN